jgi:hypothetical protein
VMNSLGTDLDVKYQNDIGAVLGVNLDFLMGELKSAEVRKPLVVSNL